MTQINTTGRRFTAARARLAGAAGQANLTLAPLAEELEPRQLFAAVATAKAEPLNNRGVSNTIVRAAAVAPPKSEPLNNGGVTRTGGIGGANPAGNPLPTGPRPNFPTPFPAFVPGADEDDQIVESRPITLGQEIFDHQIGYDTDVDMFAINLIAGQIIGIDVDDFANFTTFDGVLRLFDGLGNDLENSDDDVGLDPETSDVEPYIEDFEVPITGTYYIGVSGATNDDYDAALGIDDVASDFGPYILSTILLGDANDTDDQIGEARGTTAHYTRDGSISNPTDVDMFRITAKLGERFIISVAQRNASNLDSALQILDASGNIVGADYGGDTMISFVAPTKGNFYVAVSGNANVDYDPFLGAYDDDTLADSIGDYRLKIDKV